MSDTDELLNKPGSGPGWDSARVRLALVAIVTLGVAAHFYHITAPLFDWHYYRQHDTAAFARNFYEEEFNIFYPRVDWRGASPGYVESEFQIYTASVAVLYHMLGPHEWVGRAVNIAFYAASAILLFLFTKRLLDDRTALLAVLFYSMSPLAFFFTRSFQPDALLALASLAAVYFFWLWTEEDRWTWFAISALALAVAVLIKPPTLYLGAPLAYLSFRKYGWRFARQPALWAYAVLIITPSILWYAHAYSLWVTYGNTMGLFGRKTIAGIWPFGDPLWTHLAKNLAERLILQIATPPGVLFLVVGFFTAQARRSGLLRAWVAGFAVYVLLVPQGHWGHNYYQLPIVFVAAVYMAYGAGVLLRKRVLSLPVIIGLVIAMLASSAWQLRRAMPSRGFEQMAFGRRVNELTKPGDLLVFVDIGLPDAEKWPGTFRHRTPEGYFLWADPIDFYHSHRKGWSLDDEQATPEYIESLRTQGADYFATRFPEIVEQKPALIKALTERYTPVERTPEWLIVRLDGPTEPLADGEVEAGS